MNSSKHHRTSPRKVDQVSRRDFLKLSGLAAGVLAVAPAFTLQKPLEPQVEFDGVLFRGTGAGKLYQSADRGQTWQQAMDFGPNLSVVGLSTDGRSISATLQLGSNSFNLQSTDAQRWYTE